MVSTSYCAGATVNVSYTITGTFSNVPISNDFSIQISDAGGTFSNNPETVGVATSTTGGTILCTLPSTLLTSNLYRFRVASSNPTVISNDNGVNLTVFAITLNTPTLGQSSYCQNETFTVNFSQSGCNFVNFPSANVYSVELSDAAGNFTNPIVIGTRTAVTAGTINCLISPGTIAGSGYRIRISSSSPSVSSSDNGSNITIAATAGTPSIYGNGAWNVYCYAGQSNYSTDYRGFYTETALNFNTTSRWANTASPSSANATGGTAYQGCFIGTTAYSYVYKRTNIPCGYYQIDIPSRRNEVYIIINGVTVYSNTVCCAAVTNAWTGVILTSDNVEIRSSNLSPQGFLNVTFTKLNQVSMSTPVTICAGSNASLTVTNTGTLPVTFSWAPTASVSPITGSSVIGTPTINTTYTATGSMSACPVFSGSVLITVNALPSTATGVSSTVICNGNGSSTITATGANTYSWLPAAGLNTTVGNVVIATPSITTAYTVTGSNNCATVTAVRNISVQTIPSSPSPTAFGSGVWNVYCYNSSAFSTQLGFYTENNLSFTTTSRWAANVSPSSANAASGTSYTGCTLSNAAHGTMHKRTNFTCGYYTVNFIHDDVVTLFVNGTQVFQNLTAGTDNAAWTGFLGPSTTLEIRHANTSGATSSLAVSFVTVAIPVMSPPVTICAGSNTTLKANNISGLSYSWTPSTSLSATTGTSVVSNTSVNIEYTCAVTDAVTSCTAANTISVSVNSLPTTTVTPSLATINCTAQVYTLTVSGANTYSWSPSAGLSATTGNSVVATPSVSTVYTVSGNNNCSSLEATTSIVVVPLVNPTVFPTGAWNAYCYNGTGFANYFGYYTENGSGSSGYDFNTTTRWASGSLPSNANTTNGNAYLGCTMPSTNWSISFKRKGFVCNTYSLHVLNNDKTVTIFINGTQVATRAASTNTTALWVGVLSSSTTVELRLVQTTGGTSGLNVFFNPASTSTSLAVWAGASSNNWFTSSNWCGGAPPSASTDVLIYNSGTSFLPVINASGAACGNLTITGAVASTATLSAIAAAGLTISGAFNFSVNGNWINNGTFSGSTSTVSILGSGDKTLSCSGTQTFNVLSLNNSGSITIPSGTHRIATNLDISSGIVVLSGSTFQFLNGATVINANNSGYIDGTVIKTGNQAFTFPVGDNGAYRPISISAPVVNTDAFTAQYFNVDPSPSYTHTSKDAGINRISRCEHWILNRTAGSSIVKVTLTWDANSCGVTTPTDIVVSRWNGSSWKDHGNGGTTGNSSAGTVISSAPVTAFSPFTLASKTGLNPLPIELIDFSASCQSKGILFNWAIATEINNHHFAIDYSDDAMHWFELKQVQSDGDHSVIKEYSYLYENKVRLGKYYRLRQVDLDGRESTFKTVYLNCDESKNEFKFYPNPAKERIELDFHVLQDINGGLLRIFDQYGKEKLSGYLDLKKGSNEIPLQIKLPAGIYYMLYQSDSFNSEVFKLVIID